MNGDEPAPDDDDAAEAPQQYDAGDARAVRKRETARQRAQREADDFWRHCLSTKVGRRELWRLIADRANAFNTRFACGPNGFPQTEATWFQAGEQSLGLDLYHSLMRVDPAGVMTMMAENDPRFAKVAPPKMEGPNG